MTPGSYRHSQVFYHLIAFLVVSVWGSTFVYTKLLLQGGFSPAQIFTLRFLIAYVLLLGYSLLTQRTAFRLFSQSWRDEWLMVLLGITGGSVYFLTENAAMLYTTATNTSLIVCSCPLFTMLLIAVVYRRTEHFGRQQIAGSLLACLGMAIVVLNGRFVLHLSPKGDLLAFAACLCWAVYSLLIKEVVSRYSALFVTRKCFFWGLVTIVPYYLIHPGLNLHLLADGKLLLNLLYLGVVASMLCFLVWNKIIPRLGAVATTNWVYLNPLVTIIFAYALLSEPITPWLLLGTVLILGGMYLCDRH